jgi:hypothetical protein
MISPFVDSTSWILMQNAKISPEHIVCVFKTRETRLIREAECDGFQWQSNYYEHIVRNKRGLRRRVCRG